MKIIPNASTACAALAAILTAFAAAVRASGGDFRLHPFPRAHPPECNCEDDLYALDEGVARCQIASDFLIALAYFSIPVELIYFFLRAKVFPFRWMLVQFGLFIVLCGMTHVVAIWTYGPHPRSTAIVQTVLKVLTAAVSCATAILLIKILPSLLNLKVRELFLQHKAAQLDREMGVIKQQEQVGRNVRMLTHEIRQTLDRHTILNTTLITLAHILNLKNCTIWMPTPDGTEMELTHELERRLVQTLITVPANDTIVQSIICSDQAVQIPSSCSLGPASSHMEASKYSMAAVRLPLLSVYEAQGIPGSDHDPTFAIMVLLRSGNSRPWKTQEVEMVEVVADQVAVALSHAAVLEEVQRARDEMVDQNRTLQLARKKAQTVMHVRNDFLAVMNHEMRTPLHSVIAVTSILQEAGLTEEQIPMVETVLKSASLLTNLINDVLDFSRLEESSLQLECRPFELPLLFREAGKLAWPMARGKGLKLMVQVAEDVPTWVMGDEKRLFQTTLNLIDNAIKSTHEGFVTVRVMLDNKNIRRDPRNPTWEPMLADRHVYIRVEVQDTGCGLAEADLVGQFQRFATVTNGRYQRKQGPNCSYGGTGLGLSMCQKYVELMAGHIWVESPGPGKGATAVYCVRLQLDMAMRRHDSEDDLVDLLSRELSGVRVMIVEDNPSNRMVTCQMLEVLNCEVFCADSGMECMAQVNPRGGLRFDAMLLDICMSEMDGFILVNELQHLFRPEERPLLVALSGRTDKGVVKHCHDVGFDEVLLKPISLREIGTALCELRRRRSSQR